MFPVQFTKPACTFISFPDESGTITIAQGNPPKVIEEISTKTLKEACEVFNKYLKIPNVKLRGTYRVSSSDRAIKVEMQNPLERINFSQYVSDFFFPRERFFSEESGDSSLIFRGRINRDLPLQVLGLRMRLQHCEYTSFTPFDPKPLVDGKTIIDAREKKAQARVYPAIN